jgi:hypothetical protein
MDVKKSTLIIMSQTDREFYHLIHKVFTSHPSEGIVTLATLAFKKHEMPPQSQKLE